MKKIGLLFLFVALWAGSLGVSSQSLEQQFDYEQGRAILKGK